MVTATLTTPAGALVAHGAGDHAVVEGAACPHCAARPWRVRGRGARVVDDRAYAATAACVDCGADVGTLRVEAPTIFGLEEDRAVLQGRARVYA